MSEQHLGTYLEKQMRRNSVSIPYSACRHYDTKIPFLNIGLLELDKERFHLCTHLNHDFHVKLLFIFMLFTHLVFSLTFSLKVIPSALTWSSLIFALFLVPSVFLFDCFFPPSYFQVNVCFILLFNIPS